MPETQTNRNESLKNTSAGVDDVAGVVVVSVSCECECVR